jgi:hypothetical protein
VKQVFTRDQFVLLSSWLTDEPKLTLKESRAKVSGGGGVRRAQQCVRRVDAMEADQEDEVSVGQTSIQ